MAEPDKLGTDGFSVLFARFNQSFLARQEGLSMLILESRDAAADAADFKAAGIAASEAMSFEREGRRPDGTPVKVGFSLAFARDDQAPDIGFATCQQHFPENFWNPAFQQHRQYGQTASWARCWSPQNPPTTTFSSQHSPVCANLHATSDVVFGVRRRAARSRS